MHLAWYISIGLHIALLARLASLRLLWRYRALTCFLFFSVCRSIALVSIAGPQTLSYTYLWLATEPLLWAFSIGVAVELYGILCRHYPGIEKISKPLFIVTMGISAVIAAAPLFVERQFILTGSWLLLVKILAFIGKRFVLSAMALFVSSLALFSFLHPTQIRKNARVYGAMATSYFVLDAAQALIGTSTHSVFVANAVILPLSAACLAIWVYLMRSLGEELPAGHVQISEEKQRLIDERGEQILGAMSQLRPRSNFD